MKAYLITTGAIFALITVFHILRTSEIVSRISSDPWFVAGYAAITLVAAGMAVWAWRLLHSLRNQQDTQ